MGDTSGLQRNWHWRMAVWALRVGYVGLVVALAGFVALALGSTSWILASGVIIWLATVPVTLTGFLWARREVPEPRPRLWSMRLLLIHDSVHAVSPAQQS
jgi:small-conductance mechanosensitive channel